MKLSRTFKVAALTALFGAGIAWVSLPALAEEEHGPATRPAGAPGAPVKNLEKSMERMGSSVKKLKKQIPDKEQTVAALETIKTLQTETVSAKSVVPGMISKMPADKQAEAKKDYVKMMSHTLELECTVEQSLLDGDLAAAQKAFDEITEVMKEGHKEFRPKKEERD